MSLAREVRVSLVLHGCSPFHFPGSSDKAWGEKLEQPRPTGARHHSAGCSNSRKKERAASALAALAGNIYHSHPSAFPAL